MAIIVQDSFTDVDGTPLQNHTPEIGGTWNDGGSIISGNKAQNILAMWQMNNATMPNNQYVKAEFYTQSAGYNSVSCSLIFRAQDTLNFYEFLVQRYDGNIVRGCPAKVVGGFQTILAGFTEISAFTPLWVPVRAEMIGTTINLYLNDVLIRTIEDSTFSSGKAGFRQAYPVGDYITGITFLDNFEAGSAGPPPSPTNLTLACGI